MNNWFSKLLADTTPQGRNAFRTALIGCVAVVASLPLYFYVAVQTGAWQIYALIAGLALMGIATGFSAYFARRNQVGLAVGILLGGACALIPYITALVAGLGIVLGLTLFFIVVAIIGQTLSGRPAVLWVTVGSIFTVATLLIDAFAWWPRQPFPLIQSILPYISGAVIIAFGFFAVRQFSSYSLRTKLLISIVTSIVLSIAVLAGVNYYYNRVNLTETAGQNLKSIANSQASAISGTLYQEARALESFSLSKIVQDQVAEVNTSYGSDDAVNLQQIDELDQQWRAADAANNNLDPLVYSTLNSAVSSELLEYSETFPENTEVFVTDRYGALVAASNRTSDYYQADEDWWQAAYNNGQGAFYFGQPEYDASSQTFGIIMAIPMVEHGTSQVIGVLRTTLDISTLIQILDTSFLGGTVHTNLYLPGDQALAPEEQTDGLRPGDPEALARLEALTDNIAYDTFALNDVLSVVSATPVTSGQPLAKIGVENLGWVVVVDQSQDNNLAPLRSQAQSTLLVALVIIALGLAAAIALSQTLTGPILRLTQTAQQLAGGDFAVQASVEQKDEIGTLASAFNTMTSQLRELVGSLEQRVAERTRALSSVAEVSTAASTILETDKLLQEVVDLTKTRFNFYHAHIYLLNDDGDTLVLASGAGEPGRQMVAQKRSIPLNREQSLVARAARERKGVTVNDVTTEPDFLPNPLLPDTRSELAVPMLVGEQVIGVFDVQSEVVGRFTDADIAVQTTLASQVASAIQNARSYTEVQRSQALLSEALNISRLANWEYDFENDRFHFNDQFYSIFRTSVDRVGAYEISSADYARIFVHPDDAPLVGSEIQKVLDSKERYFKTELEHRIIFADGEVGYISVKINVDRDEKGKIVRWYGANQDVTERRRLEDLNRQRAHQQEALNLITQKIQSATTIEEAMQVAARELGQALGKRPTLVTIEPSALNGNGNEN